jgi:MFS family permease
MTARARPANLSLEKLGLVALGYAPFRIFFLANLASNASWFIFSAALNTYILQLTNSEAQVGFASFIYTLPSALFMLHAGILTDRFGSKRLVAISLAGSGVVVLALGYLALGTTPLEVLLIFAFVMGVLQTLGSPAFISIVNDLVPTRAISSAVALTFLGFNFGRIAGGIAAGFLLVALSPNIMTAAALAIIVAAFLQGLPAIPVARIHVTEAYARTTTISLVRPLLEAGAYAVRFPTLGILVLLAIAPGAIGLSYMYLLPDVVRNVGADPNTVGLLYAGGGAGGLLAGLIAEPLMQRLGHGRSVFTGLTIVGIGMIVTGAGGAIPIAMAGIGLAQAGFVLYASSSLALVQAISPARLRGRVTALFTLLYWGLMPIGALLEGTAAEQITSLTTLVAMGAIMLIAGLLVLAVRPQIASLRLDRDGSRVTGNLVGSGLTSEEAAAA